MTEPSVPDGAVPWPTLRAQLASPDRFPRAAVAAAHAQREAVAPHLLQALEEVVRDPETAADSDSNLHLLAMLLLACWRDTRAYRPLLALGHLEPQLVDLLLGDMVGQSYGRCLASVCDGNLTPLRALVEDEQALVWVRISALGGWKARVLEGDASATEFAQVLAEQGERAAERLRRGQGDDDDFTLLGMVALQAGDIGAQALLPQIRRWYQDDLIDETLVTLQEVEADMAVPLEQRRQDRLARGEGYVTDVGHELRWLYHEPPASPGTTVFDAAPEPFIRALPKVGRNDPCPCGSGKKFKKCHGA